MPTPSPDQVFVTANEIHIPVGRPVRLELAAADVIHSFWVPNLAGKQDLIPGRDNDLTFTAERAGHLSRPMRGVLRPAARAHGAAGVAEPPERLRALAHRPARRRPRRPRTRSSGGPRVAHEQGLRAPATRCAAPPPPARSGRTSPMSASRQTIAAGLLPTTRGSLAAWIADPQTIKPGNNMPMVPLTADELQAVSAYLAALQ